MFPGWAIEHLGLIHCFELLNYLALFSKEDSVFVESSNGMIAAFVLFRYEVFGQIAFFTGGARTVTVKSRGFSELMYLSQVEFLNCIYKKHTHAIRTYEEMREKLTMNQVDPKNKYDPLFLKCYHCHAKGHIAIDCDFFHQI